MASGLMLAITVKLLHGTIRAGSPDDTVLAGGEPEGEWPPSPARLFSALVAADGTRDRTAVTTGDELRWLERLGPPRVYASPLARVLASPLRPRFVVVDATSSGSVQDYPVRDARPVRPGVRQAPFDDGLVYVWADAHPSEADLAALRARAARVGYLGCADSPVRVTVADHIDGALVEPWEPDPSSHFTLPVPFDGFLDALDTAYDAWASGSPMRRAWVRTARAGYRPPGALPREHDPRPTVIWLRFGRAVAGRKVLALTETLRDAVLDHVQRLLPGGESAPAVLHGHRPGDAQGPQACFLALADVGHEHADGRLLGAAVCLPSGTDADVVQLVRSALARLSDERLAKPGWFDIAVEVHGGEPRPWAAHPRRWVGPSRRWASATPVIHERWTKGAPGLDEVARWCAHAGLPAPVRASLTRYPVLLGALDLRPEQVTRPGRERRPYSHLEVEFPEPVEGPVMLGRGRQLGLGLLAPLPSEEDETGG